MARTVQALIDRVWEILNDQGGNRYTSTQICKHVLDVYEQARSVRPDLFVGTYAASMPADVLATDPFALPDQFFAAAALYCAGACELRDDEFADDGRAMALRESFTKKLVSGM